MYLTSSPNPFLIASKKALARHGIPAVYISVAEGTYNVETASASNTETSYALQMYKKHLKVTQYNYPNLIGKDAALFYLVNDALSFVPAIKDKINYAGTTYTVDSFSEHYAKGDLILYKIIAVKG